MTCGDRVVLTNGDVGQVEALDGEWVDVRLLTPHNTPSCCVTTTKLSEVRDGTNIVPMPRSKAWYREAAMFHSAVSGLFR